MASGESSDGIDSLELRDRLRQLGRAALLGGVLAAVGVLALVLYGTSLAFASEKVFALGALIFGFALLGWSGSVFAGRGMENFQRYLDGNSDWSAADSRRAMVVLGGVGVGGMVGATLMTMVLGSLA